MQVVFWMVHNFSSRKTSLFINLLNQKTIVKTLNCLVYDFLIRFVIILKLRLSRIALDKKENWTEEKKALVKRSLCKGHLLKLWLFSVKMFKGGVNKIYIIFTGFIKLFFHAVKVAQNDTAVCTISLQSDGQHIAVSLWRNLAEDPIIYWIDSLHHIWVDKELEIPSWK